jgi:hypothetical protein
MAQTKPKAIKALISIPPLQWEMLEKIMQEDGQSSVSSALGYLISEENKRRKLTN